MASGAFRAAPLGLARGYGAGGIARASCRCAESTQERAERFRVLCARFFYEQDPAAKRVLVWFESSKVDQISLSTHDEAESDVDGEFQRQIEDLGLVKCAQPGHDAHFSDTLNTLETVKNQVRAAYHASVAQQQYAEFNTQASQRQSSHYDTIADDRGQPELRARSMDGYARSITQQALMVHRTEEFVRAFGKRVGCHPFLAGLRAVLQWNLESATVVAWNVSDAVFVESGGPEFADAALGLLVDALNFGHCLATDPNVPASPALVHFRDWHVDPYMSDHDLRHLLRLLPAPSRLEGRPTGEKRATATPRVNIHGQMDAHAPFFERWCVVL